MNLRVSGFDWDDGNRFKCQKHGVSIAEIQALFENSPRVAPDLKHSTAEDRMIAIRTTNAGRVLFVAFALRTITKGQLIRPISARYMHAKEVAAYEKESSTAEE
jgi:uncharacterized DUF497 family protein